MIIRTVATAFACVSMYGVLRGHGIPPEIALGNIALYGTGLFVALSKGIQMLLEPEKSSSQ